MLTNDLQVMRMAHAFGRHAVARQELVARNVAQADTPGYQAIDLPDFATIWHGGDLTLRQTRPGHLPATVARPARPGPLAGEPAPNGNTVTLEAEMMRAATLRQDHDTALAIRRSITGTLRAALGRR